MSSKNVVESINLKSSLKSLVPDTISKQDNNTIII